MPQELQIETCWKVNKVTLIYLGTKSTNKLNKYIKNN